MTEQAHDHEQASTAAYWRGETNARLRAVENAQLDLKSDIFRASEANRQSMERNREDVAKLITALETRMNTIASGLDAGLGEVKKEVYKMVGAALILIPVIMFLLQKIFPSTGKP